MTVVYSDDLIFSANKLAFAHLQRWLRENPGNDLNFDLQIKLYHRAFVPRCVAELANRVRVRGYEIVEGRSDPPRLSIQRHKDNFLRGLTNTIEAAIKRMKDAEY